MNTVINILALGFWAAGLIANFFVLNSGDIVTMLWAWPAGLGAGNAVVKLFLEKKYSGA